MFLRALIDMPKKMLAVPFGSTQQAVEPGRLKRKLWEPKPILLVVPELLLMMDVYRSLPEPAFMYVCIRVCGYVCFVCFACRSHHILEVCT